MKIDLIRKLKSFRQIKDNPTVKSRIVKSVQYGDENLQKIIFACDPITGVPRSDLQYMMSQDSSPEIAEYVRRNYLQQNKSVNSKTEDADSAIEMVQERRETLSNYAERLKDVVNEDIANE